MAIPEYRLSEWNFTYNRGDDDELHLKALQGLPNNVQINGLSFNVPKARKYEDDEDEDDGVVHWDKKSILTFIVGQKYYKYKKFEDTLANAYGCTTVSLETIYQKLEVAEYEEGEIVLDLRQLIEEVNCMQEIGGPQLVRLAEDLLNETIKELKLAEQCKYCCAHYYYYENFFEIPCPHPHGLVWARCHDGSYWPAKVVYVVRAKKSVCVQWFGGVHAMDFISIGHCELIVNYDHPLFTGDQFAMGRARNELKNHLLLLYAMFSENLDHVPVDDPLDGDISFDPAYRYLEDTQLQRLFFGTVAQQYGSRSVPSKGFFGQRSEAEKKQKAKKVTRWEYKPRGKRPFTEDDSDIDDVMVVHDSRAPRKRIMVDSDFEN
ncbi:hypothetical protein HDE_07486 [Halotydeus destructor]|nr:hypothetical protein HDE_07486 [Halotydeus destructor]